jgi:hypothetical protein
MNVFPEKDFTFNIASQYSFISIDVLRDDKKYAHLEFDIGDDSANFNKIYCEDRTIEERIKNKIAALQWPGLKSKGQSALPYSEEIKEQLNTADKIAALAVNCARGDNYRPGNFSEILLSKDHIELSQVNHMNAKSLAHKKDYSLRSLVFTIPLGPEAKSTKSSFSGYRIGSMVVEFSDRSSENNRRCGDSIEEELERLSK